MFIWQILILYHSDIQVSSEKRHLCVSENKFIFMSCEIVYSMCLIVEGYQYHFTAWIILSCIRKAKVYGCGRLSWVWPWVSTLDCATDPSVSIFKITSFVVTCGWFYWFVEMLKKGKLFLSKRAWLWIYNV